MAQPTVSAPVGAHAARSETDRNAGNRRIRGSGRTGVPLAAQRLASPAQRLHSDIPVWLLLSLLLVVGTIRGASAEARALPSPLRLDEVLDLARSSRPEIAAAKARARAASQRPTIVSALDDPMITAAVDHLPFALHGADVSAMVEQRFPLSRVRRSRRGAAEADLRVARANTERVALEIELDAARAFWMLAERRETARILARQHALAEQLAKAALARYATNMAPQADVLRAEIEVARLEAERRALAAEVRGAEIMLNTSLARGIDAAIPELEAEVTDAIPPAPTDVTSAAQARRPELRGGQAEVARAEAEIRVMRSMYSPMAMVRTGPAYTMTDGAGWMVMVGVSIPLWRGKLRAGVVEAEAMAEMASAELVAMRRMVDGEARAAREAVVAARERYLALRDAIVPRAQQAIAPIVAAYASGQVPLVSVIEAVQMLWSAERALAMARSRLGEAWAQLGRAAGRGAT